MSLGLKLKPESLISVVRLVSGGMSVVERNYMLGSMNSVPLVRPGNNFATVMLEFARV